MNRIPFAAALSLLTLAFAGTAHANVNRSFNFHGFDCRPSNADRDKVEYNEYGVYNNWAAPVTVTCPVHILRTVGVGSQDNPEWVGGYVWYAYDRHASQDVSCTVKGIDPNGVTKYTATNATSGGGPTAGVQFRSGSFPVDDRSADYNWLVTCTLPAVWGGAPSYLTSGVIYTTQYR
jgi:hypothetical protein